MVEIKYPTGVESHGGFLRVWFMYKKTRAREALGVPDTAKNRKVAGELRASVVYAIKTGNFDYQKQFPSSPNLRKFGIASRQFTIGELYAKWIELKEVDLSTNSLGRYKSRMRGTLLALGEKMIASSIRTEDLIRLRNSLLTGVQQLGRGKKMEKIGRSVRTVNGHMSDLGSVLKFGHDNGYLPSNPMVNLRPLRKSKAEPDPITRDEFLRIISVCSHRQVANLWSLAVYTGMRHGELCALAWEDIDLIAGTIKVKRNLTTVHEFTPPKTNAGTREIHLIQPAIDVLRDIEVILREYGKKDIEDCTFVFNPQVSAINSRSGTYYSVSSIGQSWNTALRRAGVRHRKAYQSRHTYACWSLSAGANPNFIASQMGHTSAQMVYSVYGTWMNDNNGEQIAMLNQKLGDFAPSMPHKKTG
ncbi:tyrosine-type recombinase/integrase [Rahnella aceris]|uniref:tyrosine-type recombinase/integrase n=1 Tax=Rahnella sp. (strain Y9602) TaxID=2703885 RepID=UPI000DC45BE8|nr:site-specific integrase [Rahnella aceris]UNK54119.1 site-specific integrase [Rahnella aceris]